MPWGLFETETIDPDGQEGLVVGEDIKQVSQWIGFVYTASVVIGSTCLVFLNRFIAFK